MLATAAPGSAPPKAKAAVYVADCALPNLNLPSLRSLTSVHDDPSQVSVFPILLFPGSAHPKDIAAVVVPAPAKPYIA